MAIKTSCNHCDKRFSAPDEYRGKKIDCPRCGRKVVVRSADDVKKAESARKEAEARLREDREKIALIESIGARGARRAGRPYYEEYQTGHDAVRHFDPRAPSQHARVRALADFLVLGAYLELLLVAVGVGLTIYLWMQGTVPSAAILLLAIVAWLVVGGALFLLFKSLGELASLFADVGDQQHDTVQLLLDVRENTERRED